MTPEKRLKQTSKFLSLVLRHRPELIGIQLDPNGWTNVDELLQKATAFGVPMDRDILYHIVATNAKQRFAFNESGDRIRANQGHSVEVDLGLEPQPPPAILYHGTATTAVASILRTGLEKRDRQQVHLSKDPATALQVGQRHGRPVVFRIKAVEMHADGHLFYFSINGIWLTDHVPPKYLELVDEL